MVRQIMEEEEEEEEVYGNKGTSRQGMIKYEEKWKEGKIRKECA